MTTRGQDIASVIKQQIEQFGMAVTMVDVGTVIEVGDGIARIHGLAAAKYDELLQFPNDIIGIALNLEEDNVGCIIFGENRKIKEGDIAKRTKKNLQSLPSVVIHFTGRNKKKHHLLLYGGTKLNAN